MDRESEFIELLKSYPADATRQEGFNRAQVAGARLSGRAAVQAWLTGSQDLALNALDFLLSIGDLAIAPLLEAGAPREPERAAQYLRMLTEAELALRRRVLARVEDMLDDQRPVPLRPDDLGPAQEKKELPRRICDQAFEAMRRLVQFGEDATTQYLDHQDFLRLTEPERDAEIARMRATDTWRRAIAGGGSAPRDGGGA